MVTVAIRILLVDEHAFVLEILRILLKREPQMEVVGEAATGQEAVQLDSALAPDVILMDEHLPDLSGIDATRLILKNHPNARVIIMSLYNYREQYGATINNKAVSGYLLKDRITEDLMPAIHSAIAQSTI
jgi:DNA-binding NarL/FixJ family response regulator